MPSTVTIKQGQVEGFQEQRLGQQGVWAFLGIPYAAAPYGPHRFAPPAPAPGWDGVRPALAYGPTALKNGYPAPIDALLPEPAIAGEDCLNLNVWTPDPGSSGLPVLVWIHGGSFVYGSGAVPVTHRVQLNPWNSPRQTSYFPSISATASAWSTAVFPVPPLSVYVASASLSSSARPR